MSVTIAHAGYNDLMYSLTCVDGPSVRNLANCTRKEDRNQADHPPPNAVENDVGYASLNLLYQPAGLIGIIIIGKLCFELRCAAALAQFLRKL